MNNKIENIAIKKANDFLINESQFKVGFLPVEQSNEKTKHLDEDFSKSIENGVRVLLEVDYDLTKIADETLKSKKFTKLTGAIYKTLKSGNKIVFSSCGSSGRLCILLESAYRNFFKKLQQENPQISSKVSYLSDLVYSIISGGDHALIRAVESFEDSQEFGKEQVRGLNLGPGDLLIGITATGETSSILGSVQEAVDQHAESFLIICVEKEIPRRLERSRHVFDHPNVSVIDMPCPPMAITGSVRMQAVTLEQLVVVAALETALNSLLQESIRSNHLSGLSYPELDYGNAFKKLIEELSTNENIRAIAELIKFEENIYRKKGLVTYYADDFLLDILTDTAERPPTFSLPAFRKCDDKVSPQSWAFAKNPIHNTFNAFQKLLGRDPRCITWGRTDYIRMGANKDIVENPPTIKTDELMKFIIGNEFDPSRLETPENAAVLIGTDTNMPIPEFEKLTFAYKERMTLLIGHSDDKADITISIFPAPSLLQLFNHLSIKLIMNIISTGCMVKMGRVMGNKMICHAISNKKLIDRGTRLISEFCGINYKEACIELFVSQEMLKNHNDNIPLSQSPVEFTIKRLKNTKSEFLNSN
jgi:N-acetylmuramic acid 6-phosphate etherase